MLPLRAQAGNPSGRLGWPRGRLFSMTASARGCRWVPRLTLAGLGLLAAGVFTSQAAAAPFFFSTGNPDGKMAMGSRPGAGSSIEIEAGDDFVLTDPTAVTHASFTGLM